jgi:hypothetical protein
VSKFGVEKFHVKLVPISRGHPVKGRSDFTAGWQYHSCGPVQEFHLLPPFMLKNNKLHEYYVVIIVNKNYEKEYK